MTWYGQNEEDRYIAAAFAGVDKGLYVDVGAYDGKQFSNTLYFEEQGWEGICIEPHKTTYTKLKRRRKNAICINAACVGDPDLEAATYYNPGLVMLGSLEPREEQVKLLIETNHPDKTFTKFHESEVQTVTLNQVLHEYVGVGHEIDFATIDTEGTELDVMHGFDLGLWKPRLVCIEHAWGDPKELDAYFSRMGYVKARVVGDNTFYCNSYEMVDVVRGVI